MEIQILNEILDYCEIGYQAVEEIVESGQRKVFLAMKTKAKKDKFILKTSSTIPFKVARIQREIDILQRINSNYFPKIYLKSFITDENLENFYDSFNPQKDKRHLSKLRKMEIRPFFLTVEEFIENIPWDSCFTPPVHQKVVVNFLFHLFSAITMLWNNKIVHRDLKPENILMKPDRTPVIIDLGIAKSLRNGTKDLTLPYFCTPCTYRFASPEQLKNQSQNINYKCDQFSIGVITFFMLTGKFPFGDEHLEGVEQILENMDKGKLKNIKIFNPQVNNDLVDFVNKLLAVEPYKRFRNSKIIFAHLEKIKGGIG